MSAQLELNGPQEAFYPSTNTLDEMQTQDDIRPDTPEPSLLESDIGVGALHYDIMAPPTTPVPDDLTTALERDLKYIFLKYGVSAFDVRAPLPDGTYFVFKTPLERNFDSLFDQAVEKMPASILDDIDVFDLLATLDDATVTAALNDMEYSFSRQRKNATSEEDKCEQDTTNPVLTFASVDVVGEDLLTTE